MSICYEYKCPMCRWRRWQDFYQEPWTQQCPACEAVVRLVGVKGQRRHTADHGYVFTPDPPESNIQSLNNTWQPADVWFQLRWFTENCLSLLTPEFEEWWLKNMHQIERFHTQDEYFHTAAAALHAWNAALETERNK